MQGFYARRLPTLGFSVKIRPGGRKRRRKRRKRPDLRDLLASRIGKIEQIRPSPIPPKQLNTVVETGSCPRRRLIDQANPGPTLFAFVLQSAYVI
jgi:hypothetical protein